MTTGFIAQPNTRSDLAALVREDMKQSFSYMSRFYAGWDAHFNHYHSRRSLTPAQRDAIMKGKLDALRVPLSYSQVQQAVTFTFSLLTQREKMFELTPSEDEDRPLQEVAEKLLHQNFYSENGLLLFPALLQDFYIYGLCVVKDWWEERSEAVPVTQVTEPVKQGDVTTEESQTKTVFQEMLVSQKNRVSQVSPYAFFPDPSVPLYAWETGRYVITETTTSLAALKADKSFKNTSYVSAPRAEFTAYRHRQHSVSGETTSPKEKRNPNDVTLTEWVGWLVPSEYKDPFAEGDTPLGPYNFPVRYCIVVANDEHVIRCVPYTTAHRGWPVSAAVFAPSFVDSEELDSTVRPTKDFNHAVSWLISARARAVSRTHRDRLIVDPTGVEPSSVTNEEGNVILKRNAGGMDVRRYVTPIPFQDTTQSHLRDAAELSEWSNTIAGISSAQLGQIASGRRSASEMSAVVNFGASRAKMLSVFFWEGLCVPMALRWLNRHRQSLSQEFFVHYCGAGEVALYQTFHLTTSQIAMRNDFLVFDGSLPSERAYTARALQELLQLLLTSPTAAMTFGLSPNKILERIYELRGLGKLKNFQLTTEEMQLNLQRLNEVSQTTAPQTPPTV